MVWKGKRPNQERRDDGMGRGLPGGLDWTGLDRTGQDRARGRETRTSKVEGIETDRPTDRDQTDQIDTHTGKQSRARRAHTTASYSLAHGSRQVRKKNDSRRWGPRCAALRCTVLCAVLRFAVPSWWWCAVLSLQTTGPPLSAVQCNWKLPSNCGPVSSMQRRHPFRFGPPFCCVVRRST